MEDSFLLYKLILIVVIFGITMLVALYSTYAERKVAAFMQDRLGPNRAGPWGLLQPLADGVKMFTKEEIQPNTSDRVLFLMGPSIAMLTALMTSAVIPWGKDLVINGKHFSLMVGDINIAVLYIFGVVSMGVYGILIGGWASNNKYSLLGAVRASSQMISYELAMGLSLVALIMTTGSMNIHDIVEAQQGFRWNVWFQPLGFIIFLICAFAECNRAPFDLPECETELVGGYHTEYSSMKLGFYLFAEYINMFVSACILASMYFGGYNFPFIDKLGLSPNVLSLVGTGIFFLKIIFFIFFFMWVRWTLPRFRFDQLLRLGWRILIPVAIINILVTGGVIVLFQKV
jgi:NADH-quinone oxidoreductase subunit H